MIIRDAAIYICVFFLPLTFVAMVWPATGRWARRLVELLVAIILAKFVIVSILTLATAAIANTGVAEGDGNTFEQMLAGSALLVLAAWSPFALLRMIPMMEVAAASVASQRSSMSARRRIGRHPQPRRLHAPGDGPALAAVDVHRHIATTGGTTYAHARRDAEPSRADDAAQVEREAASDRARGASPGRRPTLRRAGPSTRACAQHESSTPPSLTRSRLAAGADGRRHASPAATASSDRAAPPTPPPPPPTDARPPEPPPDRRPPSDRGDA